MVDKWLFPLKRRRPEYKRIIVMVIILDFGSKINNFLLNHLSQQMVFIQPALDCCCWGYWIPARWVFQRLSRQERLRLGESSGRSLRVDWAMCAMHSWCKQAVWSTCLCPFTHDIHDESPSTCLFVCLFYISCLSWHFAGKSDWARVRLSSSLADGTVL